MAMSVTYANFCGRIVAENRSGVVKTYGRDTLGNTVALRDTSQHVTDSWSYWPFGEVATRTGTTPTPFQYCGTKGYYFGILNQIYVRARFYLAQFARWLTLDPMWPLVKDPYQYCESTPVFLTDPSGLIPGFDVVAAAIGCAASGIIGAINGCMSSSGNKVCQAICRGVGGCIVGAAVGFLTATFPQWAKCLIGFAAGVLGSVIGKFCDKICGAPTTPINIPCTLAIAVLGAIIGCVAGIVEAPRYGTISTSVTNSMIGKICSQRF